MSEHSIVRLFEEAGAAHHRAFAATGGEDPDWPRWYAEYLANALADLLGRPVDAATLAGRLAELDRRYREQPRDEPWPVFYARSLVDET